MKKVFFITVIILIGISGYLFWTKNQNKEVTTGNKSISVEIKNPEVFFRINDGKNLEEDSIEAVNALAALESYAAKNNIKIEMKKYDFGALVTKIGGLENNSTNAWFFKVDGKPAEMAADKYLLKGNETVEWYYDEIKF